MDKNQDFSHFSGLTPDLVLDAVEQAGWMVDGRLLALNSYENRVYQVGVEDGQPLIAKFYRPERWSDAAIIEEHQFSAALAQAEVPVVTALPDAQGNTLRHWQAFRFAVFPRQRGHAPELHDPATLEWLGRFIGRIHAQGASTAFAHRPALNIQSFGFEPRAWLLQTPDLIPDELKAAWADTSQRALDQVQRQFDLAGDIPQIRLHGDCHPGNVLWVDDGDEAGPHFVDFDDARSGPPVQDLWMLLSGERADMQAQLGDLLAGYEDFYEFHPRQLHLIEALRTLRLIHYSAWLAQRRFDPAFVAAFSWFGTPRYWQEKITELQEQIAAMQAPTLWPV